MTPSLCQAVSPLPEEEYIQIGTELALGATFGVIFNHYQWASYQTLDLSYWKAGNGGHLRQEFIC